MTKMSTTEHSYFYEYILKGKKKKIVPVEFFFFNTDFSWIKQPQICADI